MPEQRISYRLNPLPESETPQRPTKPVPPSDIPENLYKTPAHQIKAIVQALTHRRPARPRPEAD